MCKTFRLSRTIFLFLCKCSILCWYLLVVCRKAIKYLLVSIANDVLVHAFEKGDYKKIILPFMVLRRIDVLLEPTKEKVLAKKEFCDKNGIVERILIVADKFQTGYDQPLLHTMYVDKMHIFYSLLVKKLPKLRMDDDTDGLLDNVDFDKYRIVKEEERAIVLENENAEVNPVPVGQGGGIPQPEPDSLSNIIKDFNESFGGIEWKNEDEVQRQISELPTRIAKSVDFVNAVKNGDKQAAQILIFKTSSMQGSLVPL